MRRASVRVPTLVVIVALLLAVGVVFAGSPLAQNDGDVNGAFIDESGNPIAADQPIDTAAATAEPALVSPETLGAVGVAVAVALLVVAVVRRADR
ncbi:hypothetical protein C470_07344 [Halorubrum distributum JCM 13561]|uniref:Uncharacterized protein n=1 Tax=Halorubrum distributum JCM 13561 TaxID=1227483 RepID=M0NU72_9EURY|nr:hypothetical protein [Halorubrum litoreum]EMA61321.1 hypothetical protein C470_07344 [Halorubrum litoreum JCM 13561]